MRLDRKRALDYWIGRPFLACLQGAARVIALLHHRDHAIGPVRSVVFAKFQGIGSLVICKPAIAALRKAHPDARCIFWGTPALAAFAEQMPEFDEILVLDDRSIVAALRSIVGSLRRIWRWRVDWAFDLEVYSRFSSALITMTCGRNRAGFALEGLRSRRVHTHLVYFNRYHYVGEAYGRLIGQMLPPGHTVDVTDYGDWRFDLAPMPSLSTPYFVVNIHAGDLSLERRWPLDSFRALIVELLRRRPDATVVLIGHGEAEVRYGAVLERQDRLVDLAGRLSLIETVRVLANAELVVTNDSGPLHLALATRAPVVALFGPTLGSTYVPPNRTRAVVVQEPIYCSPCVHHWEPPPCRGDNQCMKRLNVSRVLAACEVMLGLPDSPPLHPIATATSDYYPGLVYSRAPASQP